MSPRLPRIQHKLDIGIALVLKCWYSCETRSLAHVRSPKIAFRCRLARQCETGIKRETSVDIGGNIPKTIFVFVINMMFLCSGCARPIGQPTLPPFGPPIIGQPISPPTGRPIGQPISNPIGPPIGPPVGQPVDGIFSLSGSATQQATVRAALSRCTFPFDRLIPGLQRAGLRSIDIVWEPTDEGSLGWASTGGQIGISNSIDGLQAQRTVILELGHAVDFFYLTPEMRKSIIRLWHPDIPDNHEWFGSTAYWDQNGEAFSTLFLWAFADEELWIDAGYSHKPSAELASELRAILLPETVVNWQ